MSEYIDENGYKRGKINHSDLVHRQVAYEFIYKKNKSKYPKPFSSYVVHHVDGDKKNNDISNLQIMTQKEHEEVHGIIKTKKEKDLFEFEEKTRKRKIRPLSKNSIDKILEQNRVDRNNFRKRAKLKEFGIAQENKKKKRKKIFIGLLILLIILFGYFVFFNSDEDVQQGEGIDSLTQQVEPYEILIDKYTMIVRNNQNDEIHLTIEYQRYSKWFGVDEMKEVDVILPPKGERKIVDEGFASNSGCSTSPCQLILKNVSLA